MVLPLLVLFAGCKSDGGFTGPAAILERIEIEASPIATIGTSQLALAAGNEQPFEAMGHYSDGSSHALTELSVNAWHTSDAAKGTFETSGILTAGNTTGDVTIYATHGGITSNEVEVTITDAVIVEIQVTPASATIAKGQTEPLIAMATYSDGTGFDVTDSVAWYSDAPYTATVMSEGVTGVGMGEAAVTATLDDITSNTVNVTVAEIIEIHVTPSSVDVVAGYTESLTAMATYSDGEKSGVTSFVTWLSNAPDIATVTSEGVTGVTVGEATVTASHDDITSHAVEVNVTDAVIVEIQVTPAFVTITKGQTESLTAMAAYSDGTGFDVTDSVAWLSNAPDIATVTSEGVTGVTVDESTTVTATLDDIPSNTVNVTVAEIIEIQVAPSSVNVVVGHTEPLTAMAMHSDGETSNVTSFVTWLSNDPYIATVTSEGVTGLKVGETKVTASHNNATFSNEVGVDVCDDLAGVCIDIFDTGGGKLFTNSPSEAYLDSIGGSLNNGTNDEDGTEGPVGSFYIFSWDNASSLCTTYNSQNVGGRNNWRLATFEELKEELYDVYGNMFDERVWPTFRFYWSSSTPPENPNRRYGLDFQHGATVNSEVTSTHYASCVSEP